MSTTTRKTKSVIRGIGLFVFLSLSVFPASANTVPETTTSQLPDATKSRIQQTFLRAPLTFEANQGQTDSQVKFLARGSGYTMFLTPTEAVLALRKPDTSTEAGRPTALDKIEGLKKSPVEASAQNSQLQSVVRMKLTGANPDPKMVGLEELPGKVNYFIGNDPEKWRTNISTYAKVEYRDLYPGVDVVYYGNQRQLEYDFVVSPGTDPSVIQLAFEGTDKIDVDSQGDLILHTALGELKMHKPLVYQEVAGVRKKVAAAYVLNSGSELSALNSQLPKSNSTSVGFQVASYDLTKPLVIDPVLVYSTYLDNGFDYGDGIAVDSSGNAYITGPTGSTNFPTVNPLQATLGGSFDAFVTKLNAAGSAIVYSTYLGGNLVDAGVAIGVDSSGNAYITGLTFSTNFPTANALQATLGGSENAFVTKIEAFPVPTVTLATPTGLTGVMGNGALIGEWDLPEETVDYWGVFGGTPPNFTSLLGLSDSPFVQFEDPILSGVGQQFGFLVKPFKGLVAGPESTPMIWEPHPMSPPPDSPVLFLHGIPGDRNNWENLKEFLCATSAIQVGWRFGGFLTINGSEDNPTAVLTEPGCPRVLDSQDPGRTNGLKANFFIAEFRNNNAHYNNGFGIYNWAKEIEAFLRTMNQVTQKTQFNLVAHSVGGLAARAYIQPPDPAFKANNPTIPFPNPISTSAGTVKVEKIINYGTPHSGISKFIEMVIRIGDLINNPNAFNPFGFGVAAKTVLTGFNVESEGVKQVTLNPSYPFVKELNSRAVPPGVQFIAIKGGFNWCKEKVYPFLGDKEWRRGTLLTNWTNSAIKSWKCPTCISRVDALPRLAASQSAQTGDRDQP